MILFKKFDNAFGNDKILHVCRIEGRLGNAAEVVRAVAVKRFVRVGDAVGAVYHLRNDGVILKDQTLRESNAVEQLCPIELAPS